MSKKPTLREQNEELRSCLRKVKVQLASIDDAVAKDHSKSGIRHHLHALHSFVSVTIETAGVDIHQ